MTEQCDNTVTEDRLQGVKWWHTSSFHLSLSSERLVMTVLQELPARFYTPALATESAYSLPLTHAQCHLFIIICTVHIVLLHNTTACTYMYMHINNHVIFIASSSPPRPPVFGTTKL